MWYTYKLTADSDDRYYLGVRHCPKNRTPETDEYFGSGMSQDFIQWRKLHLSLGDISKEIIETFELKDDAYLSEEHLIGNLWQTDPLILNSSPGGKWNGRLLPYPPCVECKAGSGNHWVHCSKYKEREECAECGGKSSNHKRICSKAVLCVECSGAQGRHKRSCSLYIVTDPCEECGAPKLHRKFCSKIKLCGECGSFVGSHKWNCSLGPVRSDCGECGSPINAHKKVCSKWSEPRSCSECQSTGSHFKSCSMFKQTLCNECGSPNSHKKVCSKWKERESCGECGSQALHLKICSRWTPQKGCPECGATAAHKKNCSTYLSSSCDECGHLGKGYHFSNCSRKKIKLSCKECGNSMSIHKNHCSLFMVCGDCGKGTRHSLECSRPGRVLFSDYNKGLFEGENNDNFNKRNL